MGVQVNVATIASGLKQLETGLREQFEQGTETANLFGRGSAPYINGKGWRIGSHLRPPTGVGGISEGGSFSEPGAETIDDMYVYRKNMSMAWEVTGNAIRDANDESSFIDGLQGIMERRNLALKKERNRQMFNDGSGVRAAYKSGTTTLLLYNAIDHSPLSSIYEGQSTKGSRHLEVGEKYDVYDSTLATYKATVKVLTRPSNKTVTIAAAWGSQTDGDLLVLGNSLFKMPNGLPYIVGNSGIFQLQSRTTYPQLSAPVKSLGGASITVADFTFTKNLLISRAGVGKAKTVVAIMSLAQDNALRNLGMNFKRWDGDAKVFDQSFDKFQHGDTVEQIDPDCGESQVYLVVKSEIKRYVSKELSPFNEDGNDIRMRSGSAGYGADAFTGAIGVWENFGCEEPRVNALIKGASLSGLSTQVADA